MAAYGEYEFDLFETRGSAAPVRREDPREAPQKKTIRRVPKRNKKELADQRRTAFFRSCVIMGFAAAMLIVFCMQISVGARRYELSREIADVESALREAKSENVRLNSELNGITSIDKICTYATQQLGMCKAESYQVECIDMSEGDVILFANGQAVSADDGN